MVQLIHKRCERSRCHYLTTQPRFLEGIRDKTREGGRRSPRRGGKEGHSVLPTLLARRERRPAPYSLRGGRFECVSVMFF